MEKQTMEHGRIPVALYLHEPRNFAILPALEKQEKKQA